MSRHDYSQSTVLSVSDAIINCKNTVENTVLSIDTMPYSWDSGIINNVVTWFEVLKINYYKDELKSMFEKADSRFSGTVQDIGKADSGASGSLENGLGSLRAFTEKIGAVEAYSISSVASAGAFAGLHGLLLSIAEKYNKIDFDKLTEEERKDYYERLIAKENLTEDDKRKIQDYIDYLQGKYTVDDKITEEEKMFIALYEKLHECEKDKMNEFFENSSKDGIGDVDKYNIKFIAYTSKGNCHDIFFEYIDECHVVNWNYKETAHYNRNEGGVSLDISGDSGLADKRGAYITFFHEIGHHIDDVITGYSSPFSITDCGNKLWHSLKSDVEGNFSKWLNQLDYNSEWINLSQKDKDKILDVLMGRKSYITLNAYLLGIADGIKLKYYNSYNGYDNNQITDITGGVTNNYMHDTFGIKGQPGHDSIWFWEDSYWYYKTDENGNPILDKDGNGIPIKCRDATENRISGGAQNSEFFADYFAYEMTGDKDEANAREYFKESYKVMDEAVAKKAEEIRNSRSN